MQRLEACVYLGKRQLCLESTIGARSGSYRGTHSQRWKKRTRSGAIIDVCEGEFGGQSSRRYGWHLVWVSALYVVDVDVDVSAVLVVVYALSYGSGGLTPLLRPWLLLVYCDVDALQQVGSVLHF